MDDSAKRRLAIQLATQLPSDAKDARAVIAALSDLLENWLYLEDRPRRFLDGETGCSSNVINLIGTPDISPVKK